MIFASFLVAALVSGSARAEQLLLDPASDTAAWAPDLGGEYPGASGDVAVATDAQRGRCVRGHFVFNGESRYAGVHWYGDITAAQAVGFSVRLADRDGGMVRVRDASDQEHLGGFKAPQGQWATVEVRLTSEQFGNHWGGANDGQFHFPLKSVLIAIGRGPDEGELIVSQLFVTADRIAPADRWQLSFQPGVPSGVAFPGEKAEYTIKALNRLRRAGAAELRVEAQGPEGAPRELLRRKIEVAEWGQASVPLRLSAERPSYLCLRATLTDPEAGALPPAVSGLVVVPKPRHYGSMAADCYFGLQFCPDMEAAERLGAKAVREAPGWRWAEPRQGQILWGTYLDPVLKRTIEHHMSLLLTLQAIAPDWAAWKVEGKPNLYDLPAPERLEAWRDFVRQVAERYHGNLAAIEIQNEPDLTCAYQPGLPLDEGVDYYTKLLRAGYEGVKAGDPNLPVAGCDVSGGDFDGGLPFTEALLGRAADQLDLYTGHPYASPRYFGPDQQPKWPGANRMAEKCSQALDLLAKHDKTRHMWIGELGWGLQATADPLSGYSVDFAACMTQSLLLGKSVPGVDKYLWFTMAGCNEGGYEYGLLRGQPLYPLPAALAYATAAYVLDATRPVELKQVTGELWRASFACAERDELVVAWWSDGEPAFVREPPTSTGSWHGGDAEFVRPDAPGGRWVDSFSQTLKPGQQGVKVGRLPVYQMLSLKKVGDHPKLLDQMQVTAPSPVAVDSVFVSAVDRLGLILTNKTNSVQKASLSVEGTETTVELPPGAKLAREEAPLREKLPVGERRTLKVTVTAGGTQREVTQEVNLDPLPPPPVGFQADGDLREWSGTRGFDLQDRKSILPPDPGIGWDGPADLSLRAYVAADGKGLYFAAAVTDDVHSAPSVDADNFWESDSIQLAVDPTDDSFAGFDADDREVGFVLGADGPRAFVSYPAPRKHIEPPLAIVRTGNVTTYEVFLPWATLGITTPKPGQVLAIDFIANDNDGRGRAYWMGLTPGIGEGKTPNAYRKFVMP